MMEEYTKEYYQALNNEEREQAENLAIAIKSLYHPRSIADVGCGTGLYLAPFVGSAEISGFDVSDAAFEDGVRQIDRERMHKLDLSKPDAWKYVRFDVAMCLEVLEHIGNENVEHLVDNVSEFSDTLIVTAAPPGQAGLNHVNCQPQDYWDEKFAKRGFIRDYHDEYQIVKQIHSGQHTIWAIRNLMVYKR